jgi:hypothetical protein
MILHHMASLCVCSSYRLAISSASSNKNEKTVVIITVICETGVPNVKTLICCPTPWYRPLQENVPSTDICLRTPNSQSTVNDQEVINVADRSPPPVASI